MVIDYYLWIFNYVMFHYFKSCIYMTSHVSKSLIWVSVLHPSHPDSSGKDKKISNMLHYDNFIPILKFFNLKPPSFFGTHTKLQATLHLQLPHPFPS